MARAATCGRLSQPMPLVLGLLLLLLQPLLLLQLAAPAAAATAADAKNAVDARVDDDTVVIEAASLDEAETRSARQFGWPGLLPIGPCFSSKGELGRCTSFRQCYPYFKLPELSNWETWVLGMYDTCSYFTATGRQMFGVCCTNPATPQPPLHPTPAPPVEPPEQPPEEGQPVGPVVNPIPPNWPPPIPTHSPNNTIPPLPTHPPSPGWPGLPPTTQAPPTPPTPAPTHPPAKPPTVAPWPPTHPPAKPPTVAPWPPTHPPVPTHPTHPPVPTHPPQPPTTATTRPPWKPPQWPPTHPTHPTTTTTTTQSPPDDTGSVLNDGSCGARNGAMEQERIVGGQNADIGEWPWMAALFNGGRQFCGGSLIDNIHILTAAHCVAHMSSWDVARLTVHLGDHNIKTNYEVRHVVKKVKRVVRHRGFDSRTLYNDVAVLTLDSPVTYTQQVHPICLPSGNALYAGQTATVIGWGSLRESGRQPEILQEVSIPIWTNHECRAKYGGAAPGGIVEHFLCAGYDGKDSCSGDSGGPLMINSGRWMQIGIVSWGIGCGKGQYPGVYTRVTHFMPWITKNLK